MTDRINYYHRRASRRNFQTLNLWLERGAMLAALALFWFIVFNFGRLVERFHV